ncbi:MAG TPA: efflux RND transporter permease subunit [Bryobacteraceae bacterium]|jgi:multidrug efflux pump subunit AcrB|nr:efflux RND transporter permease subunit [Bryobacteraceae bacterium]
MSRFAIKTPYLIVVVCAILAILGAVAVVQMPVDMFPSMNIPVVVVATFYAGMPPEQIEGDITYHLERFFTLASGIDHIESRSLNGVSIIRVYFQSNTNADIDAATIANLAVSDMKDLPPGTLPPVVLKSDASSLPVCLVTMNGEGMTDGNLKDIAQNFVRNQLASVPGASIPQPFGGPWRQIQFYVDPLKLEARQISPMDVVRSLSQANVILPAGDVQIGNLDYNIYSNAQFNLKDASQYPVKMNGENPVLMSDIGQLKDAHALQYNVVHVNGQRSVYLPVMKQGGDSNTIAVVDGVRKTAAHLVDVPPAMKTDVVFDQSRFVRTAIRTLLDEGGIGLFLTCVMILMFLGSLRATIAVFFSIPLSVCATFFVLQLGGSSINSMVLGGLALALSRLIDNSVVVLENIYRHLETGEPPPVAAETGGKEVALPVLASTLTTAVVFFPVTLLAGVSKFLFSAMALAVVVSLFASYIVAMTVVPLFCARYLKVESPENRIGWGTRFTAAFNASFNRMLGLYEVLVQKVLQAPATVLLLFFLGFAASLVLYTQLGFSYFPQTDAGQFVITFKAPSGTKLTVTENEVATLEQLIKTIVRPEDLSIIVDNIGVDNGFSAVYTSNAAMHTGFVQVGLTPEHRVGSYEYIRKIKARMGQEMPELTPFFSTGSLVDAVVSMGAPAPIDVQIVGANLDTDNRVAQDIASKLRLSPTIADVFMPQDLDYPSLRVDIDRLHAAKLGLTEREVLTNVITSLTSNQMIAPNLWIDPRNGNNYFLTVQYPEAQIRSIQDLRSIPLHADGVAQPTRLDMIANIERIKAPTEVDHYQIRRKLDIYARPSTENLGAAADYVRDVVAREDAPGNVNVAVRGSAEAMNASFRSFAIGLTLSVVLLYLILVAQFRSFVDPFIILLALPPGISGVLLILVLTGTTLNVMSLMGVVMLAGIAMSNSILIVEFAHHLKMEGRGVGEAIIESCRVRLRPILMTSLATIIGLMPMALKLGEGSESYAPLARALIGGLLVSVVFTVFLVPAGFSLAYRSRSAS